MRASAKYIWIIIVILFVGGFLLAQTSGLLGTSPVTNSTAAATVNGEDILATTWYQATQNLEQQQTQQSGRTVSLDERDRIADQAFEQLVSDALLRQEYKRRGITVTDEEITSAALNNPPPQLMQSPDLQTDGRFDFEKYKRFLGSSVARQEGLLNQLEQYYRNEIPKEKLFDQIASDVYLPDTHLWERYRDTHDSAQISFVVFSPDRIPDSEVSVSDDEIRAYYDAHKKDFDRPGRAQLSILAIPRSVTSADSAAVRAHTEQLRAKIVGGEKFEDVAKAESADSASAANGGSLGTVTARGKFVKAFEDAAYALKAGEISQPVLTQFGYHLIKVDSRKGDSLTLRHILLPIDQTDAEATATDRKADSLSKLAASGDQPQKLDEASRVLKVPMIHATAIEGNPVTVNGKLIPSVGPWAFKGVKAGETSELFDADDGYYLARLDSLDPGGTRSLEQAKDEIRARLVREKKLSQLIGPARNFAKLASVGSLEPSARLSKMTVTKTGMFTRVTGDPELGGLPEAIGAAFSLPIGAVSEPIRSIGAVVVERVDRRVPADSAAWEAQKLAQRQSELEGMRQQRVRTYLDDLRLAAKVTDRRKQIEAATRRTAQ
jgi:peptidyl-prolyl cis-trans isomerase D